MKTTNEQTQLQDKTEQSWGWQSLNDEGGLRIIAGGGKGLEVENEMGGRRKDECAVWQC